MATWRESNPRAQEDVRLRSAYNINIDAYDSMVQAQGGRCLICGGEGKLVVDHDHACCPTKNRTCGICVRGLICLRCNTGLGMFDDDIERMQEAIKYVEKRR